MSNFLELGPMTEEVSIGKGSLTVRGITAEDLFDLVAQFPELKGIIDKTSKPDPETVLKLAPTAIANVIARAIGEKGDARAIEFARALPVGHQLSVANAIFRLTFPTGVGPFVEQLRAMTAMVQVSDENSDGVSQDVLLVDEPRRPPGNRRRAA